MDALPPVEIQGLLERKHELQSAGKKAAVRSWKQYYTVLCGQLLCFFKDMEDFSLSKAATAPITIFNAICEKADDYTKEEKRVQVEMYRWIRIFVLGTKSTRNGRLGQQDIIPRQVTS